MSKHSPDTPSNADSLHTDQPAVALPVAPDDRSDAVAGAILRAQRHGHHAFVLVDRQTDDEVIEFAHQLGAGLVEVETTRSADGCVREEAARVARSSGFPGLIWQEDPSVRVDFAQSSGLTHASSAYVVEPEPHPVVEPEPAVLVAIPAYNEAGVIGDVVREAQRYADDVLVVDDGSEDETADRAEAAGATVVEHEKNCGYGATLKTAFCEADRSGAEHLVVLDGDGQHDPADIPRLLETQTEQAADIVIGCRFGEEAETDIPFYRRIGLSVVTVLTNLSLGVVRPSSCVKDPQSGFRVYNREAIRSLADAEDICDHMGASTDILNHAHENELDIAEVGATVRYDVENGSNRNPIQHGITLVMNLVRTIERQRPITALGIPGFISTIIGLGFSYWTLLNFIQSGTFAIGLALVSSFFGLAGIFAVFTAIILHSLSTQLPD